MRLAHVRERNAPAGAPWRLAAALDPAATTWLDVEVARRRAVAARPESRPRQRAPPPAGDHARRPPGPRPARGRARRPRRGVRPAWSRRRRCRPRCRRPRPRPAGAPPPSFRDFYSFERHVSTMWERRGQAIPEAWYRLPVFYFSNVADLRGPGEPVWAPAGSSELDYELEVGALVDTPATNLAAGAWRGGDRRLLRAQRLVRPRPPARRDDRAAGACQGQGLRDLAGPVAGHARRARGPAGPGVDGRRTWR